MLRRVKSCFSHALIFAAASVCNLCGYLALWVAGILVCYIYRQQGTKVFPAGGFQNPPQIPSRDWKDNGYQPSDHHGQPHARCGAFRKKGDATSVLTFRTRHNEKKNDSRDRRICRCAGVVDCALFGARAEALAPYLTKGKKVSVDGRLRYHSWMKNDEKRHALSVLVTDIEFADSKGAGRIRFLPRGSLRNRKRMMRIFRSREDGMHLRGDSVREIPFMLFLGLLFAVTVGWWVFLTLTVSVVFGNVAAAVFAVCSALSVTVGYGLVRASDSRE